MRGRGSRVGAALGLGAVWALVTGAQACGQTVIARSLARLADTPPVCAAAFDFIVTGDTQSNRQLVYQTDLFRQMIREFNILEPACVVEVGDLILGGAAWGVPPQWDLFERTIAECRPPYFPVPGNHDISDARTEELWRERMGPTHYAFSCGNSRFIVLNSEEVGALDRISPEQAAWFEGELAAAGQDNIFVFIHHPYFADDDDPRRTDEAWERRWRYLAEMMRGRPVRAVFAGHRHGYRDFGVRDGVRYVIAAGGASMGGGAEAEGRFNHYLLVRVRGTDVGWTVIKPGSVLPADVATNDRAAELFDIRHRLVSCGEVAVPYGAAVDRAVEIAIENPFERPLRSILAWDVPDGWEVEPQSQDYGVPPGGVARLSFHIRAASADAVRFPVPVYRTRYENTRHGPAAEIAAELPLVPLADAVRAPDPVRVDGVLAEWGLAAPVALSYPSGFERGRYDPRDLSGECRAMWGDAELYLAFDIVDDEHRQPYGGDIVWLGDAVELGIDRWAWGFSLAGSGPEVFLYEGEGMSAEMSNEDVRLAVTRTEGRTVYEAAFPAELVRPLALQGGASFRLRAQVADLDGAGAKHELSLTPGGDAAPGIRVQLVEVEPGREGTLP